MIVAQRTDIDRVIICDEDWIELLDDEDNRDFYDIKARRVSYSNACKMAEAIKNENPDIVIFDAPREIWRTMRMLDA